MFILYKPLKILLFFLTLQIVLGIFTLISGLNIYLASLHQITSIFLVFSALNLYYLFSSIKVILYMNHFYDNPILVKVVLAT